MDTTTLLSEAEIRNLAYRFADAVIRNDPDAFGALWDDAGEWRIAPPMDVSAVGRGPIVDLFRQLMGGWSFFHQVPNGGVISVTGDTASARMYVHEVGIFKDGRTHRNWSEYTDDYVKSGGIWRFRSRRYHFLYVDGPPMQPDLLGMAVER